MATRVGGERKVRRVRGSVSILRTPAPLPCPFRRATSSALPPPTGSVPDAHRSPIHEHQGHHLGVVESVQHPQRAAGNLPHPRHARPMACPTRLRSVALCVIRRRATGGGRRLPRSAALPRVRPLAVEPSERGVSVNRRAVVEHGELVGRNRVRRQAVLRPLGAIRLDWLARHPDRVGHADSMHPAPIPGQTGPKTASALVTSCGADCVRGGRIPFCDRAVRAPRSTRATRL